jgi:hypothetical protein
MVGDDFPCRIDDDPDRSLYAIPGDLDDMHPLLSAYLLQRLLGKSGVFLRRDGSPAESFGDRILVLGEVRDEALRACPASREGPVNLHDHVLTWVR